MSSPGRHYNWGELVVLKARLNSNCRVVNNTQGFLERRKRVQMTFCHHHHVPEGFGVFPVP